MSTAPSARGPRRRPVVWLLGILLAPVAWLGAPEAAGAATYRVDTCGGGARPGWSSFNSGYASAAGTDGCASGGPGMWASIAGGPLDLAGWRFTAPEDTEIAGFSVARSFALAAVRPFGASEFVLRTEGPGQGYQDVYSNLGGGAFYGALFGESAGGLSGQRTLSVWVHCGGGDRCTGASSVSVYAARIELRDDIAPVISAVSGTLLAGGPLKGTRSLSYGASDRGGGLLREQLLVDGWAVVDRAVNPARCSGDGSGTPYTALVPCPLSASSTLALDTTRLAEGAHEVELSVWDATGVNRARQGPFPIVVDNVPAPANTAPPRITGTAAQGATLVGSDGAWSGSGLTLTRRWQRHEDGGWQDVAGAGGATYTATADDAGHRLRLRVVAANAEGVTDAYSEPTAPVTATAAPSPSPLPSASPVPPPVASPTAEPAALLTAAFEASGRTSATLRWGLTRRIAGTLHRSDGHPVAGAKVAISTRAVGALPLAQRPVTTDAAGRFTYVLGAGVSRQVTFSAHGASATVSVRVIPHVVLRVARAAGVVTLSGRVVGAPSGLRKRVELQARSGRGWRTFATTRLARTGATFRYRTRSAARSFRAVVRAEPGWPFLTGASRK
ncbi:hypothetical protein [Candidatus Solirubrobacter pratensis]|uniref:hypothetical protein n=1 Tax=Candidatus Solirubrobacter pratensis TaxID=1298857 RepID=UPI00041E2C77|nr:hypothetical protein [Candidatus Solirubrobacter pratensis]